MVLQTLDLDMSWKEETLATIVNTFKRAVKVENLLVKFLRLAAVKIYCSFDSHLGFWPLTLEMLDWGTSEENRIFS
jgi:hypothetical protein